MKVDPTCYIMQPKDIKLVMYRNQVTNFGYIWQDHVLVKSITTFHHFLPYVSILVETDCASSIFRFRFQIQFY